MAVDRAAGPPGASVYDAAFVARLPLPRRRGARVAVVSLGAALVGGVAASCTGDYDAFLAGATTTTSSSASGGGGAHSGGAAPDGGGGSSAGGGTSTGGSNSGGNGGGGVGGNGGSGATGGANTGGSGGGPPLVQVDCGGISCPVGDVCCYSNVSGFITCALPGDCSPSQVELTCDGPEDCAPTDACCGHWNNPENVLFSLGCEATCSAAHAYEYCHTSNDCPGVELCYASVMGGTYGYCF